MCVHRWVLKTLWIVAFSGCAHATDLKPLGEFQKTWSLLGLSAQNLVVSTGKSEILLFSWDNLQNALRLEGSSTHLSELQFSPDGNFLLMAFSPSRRRSEVHIYEVSSGKIIQKSPKVERMQKAFWLNSCRYATLGAPLENGGRLQIFKRTQVEDTGNCADFKASETVPAGKMPLTTWKDASFNVWAYYENGARELLSWLGKGSFSDIQWGPFPYFWYREQETPALVFRADRLQKKVQPVDGADVYVADPSGAKIYAVSRGSLNALTLNSKFKVEKVLLKTLSKDLVITSMWLDSARRRLLLRSEPGAYYQIAL